MKKLLFILFFSGISVINCPSLLAQESTPLPPILRIKKVLGTPPRDILGDNLRQAEQMQNEQTVLPKNSTSNTDPDATADVFKNPFIPQIPKATQISSPVNQQAENQTPIITNDALPIPQFIVSGLVWHSKKPAAIVNGQIVAIGDQVSNWVVAEITKDGVRVTSEDQNLWVKPIISPEGGAQKEKPSPYRRDQ